MKQNTATEEVESRIDKKLHPNYIPLFKLPLWLITSFVLLLASLVSLIYLYLKDSKSRLKQGNFGSIQSLEKQLDRETIEDKPVSDASIENVGLPAQYRNALLANKLLFRSMLDWLNQNHLFPGLVALVVGVTGQFILGAGQLFIGTILLVLAALFFVVLFRNQPGPGNWLTTETLGRQLFKLNWLGGISLVLAILFAVMAFRLFGEDIIPQYFPWLAHRISIGLLIFSSFWLSKSAGISENKSNNKKWNWLEVGTFLAILGIAAFMRLYRLNQIPFGLWYDEADNGLSALAIINQPESLPVFVKSTNLPAHFLYLIAFFFKIWSVSALTIRTVSVVFGMATVIVSFFLGNELFNRRLGLVLAFFLAVSRWDVNWSRIGMHGVTVPFFEILSAVLILWALRKQNLGIYTLAGLSLGLGLCFYTPLYFFPLVVGAFLLILWLRWHDLFFSCWRGFLFLALAAVIVSVPISKFAIRQTDTFSDRLKVTSIFTGKSSQEGWKAVAKTSREHLLMFNYQGDRNGRHNLYEEPMLDPISGAFMLLGVGLSLWRIRQPGSFLLIAWLLVMLMPGIFSLDFESPQSLRAIGSLPAAYLLAVVPIHALWQEWKQFFGNRSVTVFVLPLIIALSAVGIINYHIYFNRQAEDFNSWIVFSTPETIVGNTMAELGSQVDYYVSIFYTNVPTVQFLAPNSSYHLLQTYDTLPIPTDGKKTIVFFVDANRKPFILQAQHYYPNADIKEYKAPDGTVVLYQVTLKPSDIATSQGVTVSYYHNANWSEEPFLVTKKAAIVDDWNNGDSAQFPFGVKWQGVLYADHYGLYRLALQSPSPSELYLDGVQIDLLGEGIQTAEIELAKGSHELIIKTLGEEGHFELDWQPPDEGQTPIPSSHLFLPPISNNGLLGKYFPNGDWQDPPAFTQVDPWIHFYFHNQPLPRPYTVEWIGKINITKEGLYRFALDSIDESSLFIDGAQIASDEDTHEPKEGEVYLSPGLHLIRLRYADRTGYTHVNLYWTPPNSEQESIPQEVLFLP